MSYLYGIKYKAEEDELIISLRNVCPNPRTENILLTRS